MDSCEELWSWVESFITQGEGLRSKAELRSAQFRELCTALGLPQQQFQSIHVAGSKGKGQTASYIAHGLAALGLRVGLFSSPHIHSYNERIQVLQRSSSFVGAGALTEFSPQGEGIESIDISEILQQQGGLLRQDLGHFRWAYDEGRFVAKSEEQGKLWCQPNFFAVLTLLAFRSFSAAGCDWVVLETGIGGRLCPTNVVVPELSVITPVELEHTNLLGDRLELVAAEKAGIIKAGRPCVSACQYPEVEAVLRVHSVHSTLYLLQNCLKDFQTEELGVKSNWSDASLLQVFLRPRSLRFGISGEVGSECRYSELQLQAYSSTQVDNLGLALLSLQVLEQSGLLAAAGLKPQSNVADLGGGEHWEAVLQGMQHSRMPGRFTPYWLNGCLLLFDGAHTPVSCKRLLQDVQSYLDYWEHTGELKLSLLFGAVQGKNFAEMARILAPHFDEILLTRAGTFKENNLVALEQAFRAVLPGEIKLLPCVEEPVLALQTLLRNDPDLLLVCGSFYLLGELLPNAKENPRQWYSKL